MSSLCALLLLESDWYMWHNMAGSSLIIGYIQNTCHAYCIRDRELAMEFPFMVETQGKSTPMAVLWICISERGVSLYVCVERVV